MSDGWASGTAPATKAPGPVGEGAAARSSPTGPAATPAPATPATSGTPTIGAPASTSTPASTGTSAPGTSTTAVIQRGDRVAAIDLERGDVHLVHLDGAGARKQRGLGIVDPARLAGLAWGATVRVGDKQLALVRPTIGDLEATLARKAQIILTKDLSRIVYELGVAPGMRVLESGIGSGAATIALAGAVGGSGRVVVQELREDFRDWAVDNLRRAGLDGRVEVHVGDLTHGLVPSAAAGGLFDAVLLDQPEPWLAVPHLAGHLLPGARIACYTPQVSQMENAARALQAQGFGDVRCLELIERAWEVKERGSRPSFEGLGHTAFLVFGRWLGSPVAPAPR